MSALSCALAAAYLASAFLVFRHKARAEGAGRVTIRICQWQLETGVREAVDAIIRRYEQLNPRVHVIQIAIPGGMGGTTYRSWVLTQMAGGDGPDLVQWDPFYPDIARLFQPISAEAFEPNPYNRGTSLEGVPWRDTIVDGMNSCYDRDLDAYYAAPMDVHVQRILYNRTLLKAITGRDAPPQSYRQLLALCAKIRAYAAARHWILAPMANPPEANLEQCEYITKAMCDRLGERIDYKHILMTGPDDLALTYLHGDWSYDTPEAVAAFQEIKEFGNMCAPGFLSRERDAAVTDFVCGRAVMFVAPSWEATNVLGICDFPIAVFRYPYPREDDPVYGRFVKGPFSDGPLQGSMPIYMSRVTRHRTEALDFLRFMTSQEGGTLFSRYSNWQSATIGVKPSAFAAQFKFITQGYCWNADLFFPTSRTDATHFLLTHLPDLWEPGIGLDGFRRVVRHGMSGAIRSDFRQERIAEADYLRHLDAAAAEQVERDDGRRRKGAPRLLSAVNEGILYQLIAMVDLPPPAAGAIPRLRPVPRPGAGVVEAGMAEREVRFRDGLELFRKQEPYENRLDEVSRIFAGLADSGHDDAALGSRFFLGRIAQHHREVPDSAEAARQFSDLISDDPQSYWAQASLAPLALLEIYALDTASPPATRIAQAEKLLPMANTPAAQSELNMAIAQAIFYYRLPCDEALPCLLTAERLRLIDTPTRADVLLQIAELSRLAGNRAQAASHYRAFVKENPADFRDYLVRQRLAAMLR